MYLTHLSLTNFRNFSRLDVDVPVGPLVILGSNAQGKTSLLESIYLVSTFTSFHASQDRDLISFYVAEEKVAVARIVAEIQKGPRRHRLEVRVIQERNGFSDAVKVRKEVLLDGVEKKLSEMVGFFNAVMFLPQMLQIVDGAPDHRRRYLNLTIAQVMPGYAEALSVYHRILPRRNALLKQLAERGGDPGQLDYWDEQLAQHGAALIFGRIQAVQEIERLAAPIHRVLTQDKEVLRLGYQPSYDPLPAPQKQFALGLDDPRNRSSLPLQKIQENYQQALFRSRQEDIQRGVTTLGPHRDDLRFTSNQVDLGTFGSRGQVRTTMLTLKLAEVAWIKERTGHMPVLLLDEVLAELDDDRRRDLLASVNTAEQALLTTTDADLFDPQFIARANRWYIEGGQLVPPHP